MISRKRFTTDVFAKEVSGLPAVSETQGIMESSSGERNHGPLWTGW